MKIAAGCGFESSQPFAFFDYFRVPSDLEPSLAARVSERNPLALCGHARGKNERSSVFSWPTGDVLTREAPQPQTHMLEGIPFFARVIHDGAAASWLRDAGGSWAPIMRIDAADGRRVASIWRSSDGDIFVPFDLGEVMANCWSERYQDEGPLAARTAKRLALVAYYRARPALPRRLQLALRRRYALIQARSDFPRWPIEPALHELYDVMFALLVAVSREPLPWIAPWPGRHTWALVLTHDVETETGVREIPVLAELEQACGYRSAWNLVPKRYHVDDALVGTLWRDGFEVGLHGLYHDGRDLESAARLRERLPEMSVFARRWGAVGFRSPATQRAWDLMPLLGLDYDSSYPDTDPFEPQGGGCCTWLPYFNRDLIELPITLPQDHALLEILRLDAAAVWREKTEYLRAAGGLALMLTHPDYIRDASRRGLYRDFLQTYADDGRAWKALPRDVADWWRRRQASRLEPSPGGWCVLGPANGEATICSTAPDRERITIQRSSVSGQEPSLASKR